MMRTIIISAIVAACVAQQSPQQSPQQSSSQQDQQNENVKIVQQIINEYKEGQDVTKYLSENFELECPQFLVSKGFCPSNKLDLASSKELIASKMKNLNFKITMGPEIFGSGENLTVVTQASGKFNGKKIPQTTWAELLNFEDGKISKDKIVMPSSSLHANVKGGKVLGFTDKLKQGSGPPQTTNVKAMVQNFEACVKLDNDQEKSKCGQFFADNLEVMCDPKCVKADWCPCKQETFDKNGLLDMLQTMHQDKDRKVSNMVLNIFDVDQNNILVEYVLKGSYQGKNVMAHALKNIEFNDDGKISKLMYQLPQGSTMDD